jgi:hypothetical protein
MSRTPKQLLRQRRSRQADISGRVVTKLASFSASFAGFSSNTPRRSAASSRPFSTRLCSCRLSICFFPACHSKTSSWSRVLPCRNGTDVRLDARNNNVRLAVHSRRANHVRNPRSRKQIVEMIFRRTPGARIAPLHALADMNFSRRCLQKGGFRHR